MFMQITLLLTLMLLNSGIAAAANHFVLPSGSGSKSGSDWGNACAGLTGPCSSSAMTRGDTYYLGGGAYSGFTFSTPTSGTSIITIKGATAADHGTTTGWDSSFGVDVVQATFPANTVKIYSGYLTFDGNYGPALSTNGASYGFHFSPPSPCADMQDITVGQGGDSIPNIHFSHIYYEGCTADVDTGAVGAQTTTTINGLIMDYSYAYDFQAVLYTSQNNPYNTVSNITVDHVYMYGGQSYPDHHGNLIDLVDTAKNVTVSNNVFNNCAGTVCIGPNDNGNICSGGWGPGAIYGNVFIVSNTIGNGIIGATTRCFTHDTLVYNNTFTGVSTYGVVPWFQGCVQNASTCGSAVGNVVENNIVWNASCGIAANTGVGTHDYNSYLACIDPVPSETHVQTGSWNPFVNSGAGNFVLANPPTSSCSSTSAICGGLGLGSPYNVDPNGFTRGANGQFERGAYAFETRNSSGMPAGLTGQIVAR